MSVCDKSSCCGGPTRTVRDKHGDEDNEYEECLICGEITTLQNPEPERDR